MIFYYLDIEYLGKVNCYQGGHELTNNFLRKLFKEKETYNLFQYKDIIISKKLSLNQTAKIANQRININKPTILFYVLLLI